jgi:uncharacterized repeat protein (TIGR01451 family)
MSIRRKASSYLFVIIFICSAFGIQPPQTARAANITVDGITCTLIDAIIAANTNTATNGCPAGSGADVITLNANVTLTGPYTSSTDIGGGQAGLPDITSDITIQAGTGSLIQRNGTLGTSTPFRIFYVASGGSLTLDGIAVTNGYIAGANRTTTGEDAYGGGIYVAANGALTLRSSTVSNNTIVGGTGTGIDSNTGDGGHGSGGHAFGAGIYNAGNGTVTNSIVSNNEVYGGDGVGGEGGGPVGDGGTGYGGSGNGGGIANTGTITLTNNMIADNIAAGGEATGRAFPEIAQGGTARGGGFYNSGTTAVDGNTLSNNTATGGATGGFSSYVAGGDGTGGGLFNSGTLSVLTNSTVSGNSVAGGTTGAGGSATPGTGSGGGIYNTTQPISASHLTILMNTADAGNAIWTNSSVSLAASIAGTACVGVVDSGAGDNLGNTSCTGATINIGTDIDGTLRDNGCITSLPDGSCVLTHALLDSVGNPAIDSAATCPASGLDERGLPRDTACDVGAYEDSSVSDVDVSVQKFVALAAGGDYDGDGQVDAGDEIAYTLFITNAGLVTSPGTIITDSLPAEVIGASWSAVLTDGASGTTNGSGDINESITLPAGATAIYTIIGTVSAAATGQTVSNTASAAVNAVLTDIDPTNNTGTVDFVVGETVLPTCETCTSNGSASDDVDYIRKTVDNAYPAAGDTVTYTITAHNPKSIPLTEVVIYDVFDDRLERPTLVSTTHGTGTFTGDTLIVSGFTLQPDESATIIVSAVVSGSFQVGNVIPNAAILESPNASIHVSNLVLLGSSTAGNDGYALMAEGVIGAANALPQTGYAPGED